MPIILLFVVFILIIFPSCFRIVKRLIAEDALNTGIYKKLLPNKCDNPDYKKIFVFANILSKLYFTCKDCFDMVNYDQIEKHALSKCDTVEEIIK